MLGEIMGLAGTMIQNIGAKKRNEQQYNQQRALMDKSFEQNQSMAIFNKDLQMQLWKDTGPTGQMQQLKAAGLNPGLIYGMGGAGGQTAAAAAGQGQGTPTANVENTMAGMGIAGMQLGAQIELLKAQKENIQADTNKTKAETPATGQIPEKIATEIANLKQGIQNAKAQELLTEKQTEIAELDRLVKDGTMEDTIKLANSLQETTHYDMLRAQRNNWIEEETAQEKIKIIERESVNLLTQKALMESQTLLAKSGSEKNEAEIKAIAEQISQKWEEIYWTGRHTTEEERKGQHDRFTRDVTDSVKLATEVGADVVKGIIQALSLGGLLKGGLKNATPKQQSNSNIFKYKQGDKLKSGTKFTY